MKQNHKSLWTTGNKMMFMYSTYLKKAYHTSGIEQLITLATIIVITVD